MTEREAVATIYVLAFCLGAGALFLRDATPMLTLLALGQVGAILAVTTILLHAPRRTRFVAFSKGEGEAGSARPPLEGPRAE